MLENYKGRIVLRISQEFSRISRMMVSFGILSGLVRSGGAV